MDFSLVHFFMSREYNHYHRHQKKVTSSLNQVTFEKNLKLFYLQNLLVILWSVQSSIPDDILNQFLVVLWKELNMNAAIPMRTLR